MWALFMFINGFVTIASSREWQWFLTLPLFSFPWTYSHSAFLYAVVSNGFSTPYDLRTCYWHLCGYGSLLLVGLHHAAPATIVGVDFQPHSGSGALPCIDQRRL